MSFQPGGVSGWHHCFKNMILDTEYMLDNNYVILYYSETEQDVSMWMRLKETYVTY